MNFENIFHTINQLIIIISLGYGLFITRDEVFSLVLKLFSVVCNFFIFVFVLTFNQNGLTVRRIRV